MNVQCDLSPQFVELWWEVAPRVGLLASIELAAEGTCVATAASDAVAVERLLTRGTLP